MNPGPTCGRRSVVRTALTGALMLAVVAASAAAGLLWYARSTLEQDAIEGVASRQDKRTVTLPDGTATDVMNVLVVGTDDPATLTSEQRAEVAPDERTGRRPDSLMLVQVEVGGGGAALLSIPRDLRTELCDGSTGKINAAYAAGARANRSPESCLVTTVTGLTGVEIDHFVDVDFGGFLGVVDALGGVTMYFEEPMVDRKAHVDIPAGCVTLGPEEALGFVRSRAYDDDFGRIARQQRFVKEVLDEVARVGTLANPARVASLVDRTAKMVRTEDQLTLGEMRALVLGLRNLTSDNVLAHTVPATPETVGGVSYAVADEEQAKALYRSFRDGSALRPVQAAADNASDQQQTVRSGELPPVVVLNGTPVDGFAATTAELLEAHGFAVTEVGNSTERVDTTQVVHGADLSSEAKVLAELFGSADIRKAPDDHSLTLLLGADLDLATVEALASQEVDTIDPEPDDAPAAGQEPTYRATERTHGRC